MDTSEPQTLPEAEAALWATLAAIAKKEGRRDLLPDSKNYPVGLYVRATFGEETLTKQINSMLLVGAESTRAASSGPKAEHLVAVILSKLNSQTRAVICRDLPEIFSRAGNQLPEVDPLLMDLAGSLLKRLRAKEIKSIKGPLSVHYTFDDTA